MPAGHRFSSRPLALPILGVALIAASLVCPLHAQQAGSCPVGGKIEVTYRSKWYPATIKAGPNAEGACQIGYDGYGKEWDEWVGADRVRRLGEQNAMPMAMPAAIPIQVRTSAPPMGVYNCYGHYDINLPAFALVSGGTYISKMGGGGAWNYDPGTGLLSMASGPKRGMRFGRTSEKSFRVLDERGEQTSFSCVNAPAKDVSKPKSW